MSLLHEWDPKVSARRSLIPSVAVDVTALVKPFEQEVWFSIFATELLLAAAWSFIHRGSASVFSTEISLSVVTAREIPMVSRNFSATMLGCTAAAFLLFIGHIYSNVVMSSFLNPKTQLQSTIPAVHCRKNDFCFREETLNAI